MDLAEGCPEVGGQGAAAVMVCWPTAWIWMVR